MKNRIHFLPAGQIDNLGDQLINQATIDAIRPYGEVVINDLETPEWFVDAIGDLGDRRYSEFARHRFFLTLACQLLKEKFIGERLQHYIVLPPGHTSRKGFRQARPALGRYTRLLLLRLMGCRIVRAGFSIGPFDGINGIVESFGSRAFNFYGVRDRESLALARRLHFLNPQYFPDLAWYWRSRPARPPAPEAGPVIVSFRSNAFGQMHSPEYLLPIRTRMRRLLSSPGLGGRRVIVAYQVQSDYDASLEIFNDLELHGIAVELRRDRLSLDEAKALYAGACCVISNRLHVLLLAGQSGSLPIALACLKDNAKITSILCDNGLVELIVGVDDAEDVSLGKIDALLGRRVEILERFAIAREENNRCVSEGFAHVFRSAASHAHECRNAIPY